MADHLPVLILLLTCMSTISSAIMPIRMQRDFSYPAINEFKVYWNVPTFLCQKYGVDFQERLKYFGITSNEGDVFRGKQITILYDPGMFPAMLKDSQGKMKERNGGIPQMGNLTNHLEAFRQLFNKGVPQDFDGLGVIDFEAWRPVYRQNWNDQMVYKTMSKELERQHHPQWSEQKVEVQACIHFEEASRAFMEATLNLAKLLRPKALWGYYAFPYCYNYRNNMEPQCSELVEKENNKIQWMFDESTALYPSLYMSQNLSVEDHQMFIMGRLNEAWRVASRVSSWKFPRVYPYIWYKYYDTKEFLSEDDIYIALETTRQYKMGGAVIWGATENVSTKQKCQDLMNYLNNALGPTVMGVIKHKLDSPENLKRIEEEEIKKEEIKGREIDDDDD